MGSQVDLDDLSPNEGGDEKDSGSKAKPKRSTSRRKSRSESDLQSRLFGCFERIAAALDERGDDEMAEIVREDAGIMAQGLVSLTRPFTVLRTPLLAVIAIVEPVLAFGRIVRVMVTRMGDRRMRAQMEAEAQAQEEAQREQRL